MKHKEWHSAALTLRNQGLSSRKISNSIGVSKSAINNFFAEHFGYENKIDYGIEELKRPKILLLDLESAPSQAYIWRRWKENIPQARIISEGYLLTYSAKWLGENTILEQSLMPQLVQV